MQTFVNNIGRWLLWMMCEVVNILKIHDAYEKEYWKYPEGWGYKVGVLICNPRTYT